MSGAPEKRSDAGTQLFPLQEVVSKAAVEKSMEGSMWRFSGPGSRAVCITVAQIHCLGFSHMAS